MPANNRVRTESGTFRDLKVHGSINLNGLNMSMNNSSLLPQSASKDPRNVFKDGASPGLVQFKDLQEPLIDRS